jgi:hypothetical protein
LRSHRAASFAAAACLLGGCVAHQPAQIDWPALGNEMDGCATAAGPSETAGGEPLAAYSARYIACMERGEYQIKIVRGSSNAADLTSALAGCRLSAVAGKATQGDTAYAQTMLDCLTQRGYGAGVLYDGVTLNP